MLKHPFILSAHQIITIAGWTTGKYRRRPREQGITSDADIERQD
jgi:hypothetical protein